MIAVVAGMGLGVFMIVVGMLIPIQYASSTFFCVTGGLIFGGFFSLMLYHQCDRLEKKFEVPPDDGSAK